MPLQLIPKRKMVNGTTQTASFDSKVASGAQTIASSVAYPTRLLDTVYHNATPRILMVVVSVNCTTFATGTSYVTPYTDSSNPPTTALAPAGVNTVFIDNDALVSLFSITFFVLPNHYYKLTTSKSGNGSTPTKESWAELTLRN